MARQLLRVIKDLRLSIEMLASQRDRYSIENERLQQEVESLKRQLEESRKDLDDMRMEVDFLTVSHRLADSPDNLISARRRLKRLIAKIDRCVSLLKDDADSADEF
ncbi:MAG: hypothetical protein K2G13_05470 [Muribaculaceae bacterium]|nr:hypothetical protein [Muribaculaceae bacterium]